MSISFFAYLTISPFLLYLVFESKLYVSCWHSTLRRVLTSLAVDMGRSRCVSIWAKPSSALELFFFEDKQTERTTTMGLRKVSQDEGRGNYSEMQKTHLPLKMIHG